MGRAVDISPNGQFVAVGTRDGHLRVLKTADWSIVYLGAKAKSKTRVVEWIEDLKFSPDGQYLVVTSHDNNLYLYKTPQFSFVKKFGRSSSFITHVDWSLDSCAVRTNDGNPELLYYSIPDGTQDPSGASSFKNEEWATQSCVFSWNTQGVVQPGQASNDINHVDRSNQPIGDVKLVATGNDDGDVKVFRYPSVSEASQFLALKAHSSHCTKVRFNKKDTHLFSLGGNDTSVMQWRINRN